MEKGSTFRRCYFTSFHPKLSETYQSRWWLRLLTLFYELQAPANGAALKKLQQVPNVDVQRRRQSRNLPSVRQLQRNRSNYLAPLGLKQLSHTEPAGKSGRASARVPELHSQESSSHLQMQTGYGREQLGEKTGLCCSERTTKTRPRSANTRARSFWCAHGVNQASFPPSNLAANSERFSSNYSQPDSHQKFHAAFKSIFGKFYRFCAGASFYWLDECYFLQGLQPAFLKQTCKFEQSFSICGSSIEHGSTRLLPIYYKQGKYWEGHPSSNNIKSTFICKHVSNFRSGFQQ